MSSTDLAPGSLVWADFDPAVGREQGRRRPAMVVAGADYLDLVSALAVVVPLTTTDRGWPNHVPVFGEGLPRESWAMSEQFRAISRDRIAAPLGRADSGTLAEVRRWVADFLDL